MPPSTTYGRALNVARSTARQALYPRGNAPTAPPPCATANRRFLSACLPANNGPTGACGCLGPRTRPAPARPCLAAWAHQLQAQVHRHLLAFLLVRRPHPSPLFVGEQWKRHRARQCPAAYSPGARTSNTTLPRSAAAKNSSGVMMCSGMGMDAKMLHLKPTKNAPRRGALSNKPRTLVKVLNQSLWRTQTLQPGGLHWVRDAQQLWFVAWRSRRTRL